MEIQSFLDKLFIQIETQTMADIGNLSPEEKVDKEKGEEIIGTLNYRLMKMYVIIKTGKVSLSVRRDSVWLLAQHMFWEQANDEEHHQIRDYIMECRCFAIAEDIFWQMVRVYLFDSKMTVEKLAIGIRENWQVVTFPRRSAMSDCIGVATRLMSGVECDCPLCTAVRQQTQGPKNPGA